MKNIDFRNIRLTDGFWYEKQKMIKDVTIDAVYNQFKNAHRFDALKCEWKEGAPNEPHIFWDSDVAKWIEGASYSMSVYGRDEKLEQIIDECAEIIESRSDENGYFNSHFLVTEKDKRFCIRNAHELYCLGHFIEAAIAYYQLTGKDKLLKQICKYTDYVERVFKIEKSAEFTTPGHPEIELALVKLYRFTGEKRYLELAKFFVDNHGTRDDEKREKLYDEFNALYNQDEMPIRERTTAEGHSVRAAYLMSGVVDVGMEYDDEELIKAGERVFENIINKRMYITGGIGSTRHGEAFTVDYHLPNRIAYAETCAAIALGMYAGRMQTAIEDSKYADTFERVMYNGVLSGISMDGKSFFYVNPLEIDSDFNNVFVSTKEGDKYPITERLEYFGCSCCPPNIIRFIASISDYMYTVSEDTLYVQQYMMSEAEFEDCCIMQKTNYPSDREIIIDYKGSKKYLALRIPSWCKNFELNSEYVLRNGYAIVKVSDEIKLKLTLDMPVSLIASHKRVHENAGRIAVMRGPVVYCAEEIDNGKDIKSVYIDINTEFKIDDVNFMLPTVKTKAFRDRQTESLYYLAEDSYEEFDLTLIPYYAFANRGTTGMQVWFLRK